MPKLRTLSGGDVLQILREFGFERCSQRGSHMKVRRLIAGQAQTLTVPNHREIDQGTLQGLSGKRPGLLLGRIFEAVSTRSNVAAMIRNTPNILHR